MLACLAKRQDIIQLLARQSPKCDVTVTNNQQKTPLHLLCKAQFFNASKEVLNKLKSEEESLKFMDNELSCYIKALQCLKHESTINTANADGDTPLHVLLRNDSYLEENIPFVGYSEFSEFYCEVLEFMLSLCPCLKIPNKNGEYPLHIACQYQDCDAIELLDTDTALKLTVKRDSILHCACRCQLLSTDTLSYLLEELSANTFLQLKNEDGNTPLHILCETISKAGYPFYLECQEVFEFIIKNGGDVTSQNINGNTPLHLLKPYKIGKCLSGIILRSHYDVLMKNNEGVTFFDIFAQSEVVTSLLKFNNLFFEKILSLGNKDLLLRLFCPEIRK